MENNIILNSYNNKGSVITGQFPVSLSDPGCSSNVIVPSLPSYFSVQKTSDVSIQYPYRYVNWTITINNISPITQNNVLVTTSFGGATLVSSNYTYSNGSFNIGTVSAKGAVTLTYETQMPAFMVTSITDSNVVYGSSIQTPISFSNNIGLNFNPTLIYKASYPYDWDNTGNFYLLDGITPAGRLPNIYDNVIVQSNIWSNSSGHAPYVNSALFEGTSHVGNGNPPKPSPFNCPQGLIFTDGSSSGQITLNGPLYLYGSSYSGDFYAVQNGNVYLFDNSAIFTPTINGNVVLRNNSHIEYSVTINGNLSMYDTSYHDPGNSGNTLTVNGNLDVYYPVTKPVANVVVTGTTTYHGYP